MSHGVSAALAHQAMCPVRESNDGCRKLKVLLGYVLGYLTYVQ